MLRTAADPALQMSGIVEFYLELISYSELVTRRGRAQAIADSPSKNA